MSSIIKYHSKTVEKFCSSRFRISYETTLGKLKVENRENTSESNGSEYSGQVQAAKQCISEAFKRYRSEQLALCFDGGKDGHIVLDLVAKWRSALAVGDLEEQKSRITVLNIIQNPDDLLPETRTLVRTTVAANPQHFTLLEHTGLNIKQSLHRLQQDHPKIQAILMGVRRSDGAWYRHLKSFQETDDGWPGYMRINPILDWSYAQVWQYLVAERVDYCALYDQGFTSLGGKSRCGKNPELRIEIEMEGGETLELFLPAKCLPTAEFERFKR